MHCPTAAFWRYCSQPLYGFPGVDEGNPFTQLLQPPFELSGVFSDLIVPMPEASTTAVPDSPSGYLRGFPVGVDEALRPGKDCSYVL